MFTRIRWARWYGDVRHLAISAAINFAGYGLLIMTLLALAFSLLGVGLPAFVKCVELNRKWCDYQRGRTGPPIASPYPPMPEKFIDKVRVIVFTSATWRDIFWLFSPVPVALGAIAVSLPIAAAQGILMPLLWTVLQPVGDLQYSGIPVNDLPTAFLMVPLGIAMAFLAIVAPQPFVRIENRHTRWLLAPTQAARLAARVEHLTETRSEAIDSSAVELQRIERDLHDGAQARLVALTMNLGMAEDMFETDPHTARAMLAEARAGAHTAITELRALVRGIHPPLLVERGIGGALQSLALNSPVPVELEASLDRRFAPTVESAAYFTVVEAMTNAVKHSGASRIEVTVADLGDRLLLRVADDGRGGADPARGTGLRGIQRRLATFDGSMRVTSPAGGPTTVEAELPCAS